MFINFTNHSSAKWSGEQRMAAERYGEIVDIPFPSVPPEYDSQRVNELAAQYTELICGYKPDAVLVQGEMTLSFAVCPCF